jgi:Zn-dependent protease with chaperone function
MEWDLGLEGVGVLLALSLGFGVLTQLVAGHHTTRFMWLVGAGAFVAFGLLISEGWFGWATEEDLQPNYDGLSFDETLLAIVPATAVVVMTRRWIRRSREADGAHPAR